MEYAHIPVMPEELVHYITSSVHRGAGILVDCTVGEGGHSKLLLSRFSGLRIIAIDRDADVLETARQRLKPYAGRIDYINDNFFHISQHLDTLKEKIHYFLYDFGISSFHLERSGRGFTFAKDEKLDMRLDGSGVNAYHVVNIFNEKRLADIFFRFGQERWARRIAAAICKARIHVKTIHPATRVFQALRIFVNDELASIEKSLGQAYRLLASGGRIMAISFHSLEDRIVKEKFRRLSRGCDCTEEKQDCRCTGGEYVKILTKKPLRPQPEEVELNSRARSARLRVCEKL